MSSTTYRAAYYAPPGSTGIVLTGPDHSHLSDADLMAEATAEARRVGLIGDTRNVDLFPRDDAAEFIVIGDWTERG